jgi:4-amino-4-deoxy-L-arabinose transferase-like glycosyltransferase
MAASLAWFGVNHAPDQMIAAIGAGRFPQPEWAIRFPIFVLSVLSVYVLYRGTASAIGRRGAFFGGVILITTPYWFLLTRQVMTDMAYMAPLAAALGFMIIAIGASSEDRVRSYEIRFGSRALGVSIYHILLIGVLGLGLVQILYLLSRHVSIELPGPTLSIHRDQVFQGSPGNCELPGNARCLPDVSANAAALQPAVTALCWAMALGAFAWRTRKNRHVKSLSYLAMWLCVGLAFLGKAAPGFVLPFCTLVAVCLALGKPGELLKCQWINAGLLFAAIVAPWFIQAYARHGAAFFERLFLHDMYQRAFGHVHDTNVGDDTSFRYYVWQLGYGLFPWTGVVAAAALWWLGKGTRADGATDNGARVMAFTFTLWSLATFGLFTIAGTKFHHYIAPLVPAPAMLGGAALDRWWSESKLPSAGVIGLFAGVIVSVVMQDLITTNTATVGPARFLYLFTYLYSRPWPSEIHFEPHFALLGAVGALGGLGLAVAKWRRIAIITVAASAVLCSAWCMAVYLPTIAPHWGQRETISVYYQNRRNPDELLVAYAQNWMGENFYTGNHVATFKVPGKAFKEWVEKRRQSGALTFFVTTEHKTIPRLRNELGDVKAFEVLTTPQMNNKFGLARVTLEAHRTTPLG